MPVLLFLEPIWRASFDIRPWLFKKRKSEFVIFKKTKLTCDFPSEPHTNRRNFSFQKSPVLWHHHEVVVVGTKMKASMPVIGKHSNQAGPRPQRVYPRQWITTRRQRSAALSAVRVRYSMPPANENAARTGAVDQLSIRNLVQVESAKIWRATGVCRARWGNQNTNRR